MTGPMTRQRGEIQHRRSTSTRGKPAMKTDTPRPVLLKDYPPPHYVISAVDLDVSLPPTRPRVCSRLKIKANPGHPGNPGPLRLDGEMIELEAVRLNGRQLGPRDYARTDAGLTIPGL